MKTTIKAIACALALFLGVGMTAGCSKTVYVDTYSSDFEYSTVTRTNDTSEEPGDVSGTDESEAGQGTVTSETADAQHGSGSAKTSSVKQNTGTVSGNSGTSSTVPKSDKPTGDSGLNASTGKKLADDKVVDMKGYSFTILSPLLPTKLNKNSTLFEELLFQRIKEVEKAYNCKITILNSPYPDMETIQNYIVAGKKVADLLELSPYQMVAAKQLGYIVPWDTQPLIDKNDARWAASYTQLGYYDGSQYGLQFYRPEEVRFCVVFNKTLLKANGYTADAIYDLVDSGNWTFDKFQEICVKATKDTNSDGKVDQYGFCGIPNYISWGLIHANGGRVLSINNGKAKATVNDTKVVNALNFYDNLVNTKKVMYTNNALTASNPWAVVNDVDSVSYFLEGNCAFLLHESWVLNQQVKKRATFDYGMLPYPKGPQATDYSCYSANARLMCLTATNKDAEKTAIIFNALARPVDDNLDWTADVQADYFQNNDKRSIKMYNLCLNKTSYDPGYAVDSLANEMNSVFASTIFGHQSTPSAALQAISNKFDDVIAKMFK